MMLIVYMAVAAFFATVIHEFVRAITATFLGDPTPRKYGFLTANPFKYFEPIGFLLMMMFGLGWGQPVPVTPLHFKNRHRDMLITYTMPSIANLIIGMAMAFNLPLLVTILNAMPFSDNISINVLWMARFFAYANVSLAVYNLIPIYPLDGAKILQLYLSPQTIMNMNAREKMYQMLLIFLLIFPIIPSVFLPVINTLLTAAGPYGLRWMIWRI